MIGRSSHSRPPRGRLFFTMVALLWAANSFGHGGSDDSKGEVRAVLDKLPPATTGTGPARPVEEG